MKTLKAPKTLDMDVYLGHKQLVHQVSAKLDRRVDRSTVYRWRKVLGFKEGPYDLSHVSALVCFGKLVGIGVQPEKAKQITIQYMEKTA